MAAGNFKSRVRGRRGAPGADGATGATGAPGADGGGTISFALAKANANQSAPDNVGTDIEFDTNVTDPDSWHSTSSNKQRFTVPSVADGCNLTLSGNMLSSGGTGSGQSSWFLKRYNASDELIEMIAVGVRTASNNGFECENFSVDFYAVAAGEYFIFSMNPTSVGSTQTILGDATGGLPGSTRMSARAWQ